MIGQTVSHYRILEKLGAGGMGVVYRAEDLRLQRTVAIKFLSKDVGTLGQEDRDRFYREARAASLLDHPSIQTVYEIDEHEGQSFIVIGFVDGGTLQQKIQRAKLTVPEVLDLAVQIADGLHAAHEKGIVHRDIKAANVMVTSKGKAKIVDFGLAKLRSAVNITKSGETAGTLAYMSPEQIQKSPDIDHRTDIWSFGVLLYEMLAGELPFKAEEAAAILHAILHDQPAPPSALDRRIPNAVDSVVARLLQKDPALRYQDISEVSEVLREIRDGLQAAATAAKTKAIAVLPFDNISPDRESDYFGDGLTEELIANLSRLKDIRVVSRTTSMQYKGTKKDSRTIGRELGVRYIVEGSVRKFQDSLRITAQLIDVDADAQLWAETYKGKLADVFDIQEQVSRQIVDALMVKLSPTEKVALTKRATLNPEAFDCNLRARGFLYRSSKSNLQYAIQLFQKALELDPRYAAAYAGLSEAYSTVYQWFDRKEAWLDKAIETGLKALMYDSSLSEAYASLGFSYFNRRMYEDAETASRKAFEIDPNNFNGYWILARIYHTNDRDREAVDLLKKVISLNPEFHQAYSIQAMAHRRLGDTDTAAAVVRDALALYPRYLSKYPDDAHAHILYANLLAQTGKAEEASLMGNRALELNPGDPLMLYNGACLFAQLRDRGTAIRTLERALAAGFEFHEWIRRDPDLDSIREDPAFQALMGRLEK